ncbi:unnamed protein product [Rotaria socialis]
MCYFNPYVSTSYKILFNECLENDYFLKNSSNRAYLFPHFGDPISRHFVSVENILHLDENEKKSSSINYQSDFLFHACSGYTHRAQYSQLHWPGDASVDWNIYSGGYVCEFYPDLTVQLVTRWLQVGTFSGFIHDETEGSTCTQERVQMFTNNQTEYIGRQYAKLRTQNFPYIYTLVHEAHATGLPITRHHLLTILQ